MVRSKYLQAPYSQVWGLAILHHQAGSPKDINNQMDKLQVNNRIKIQKTKRYVNGLVQSQ
jgi:hypothetical protein